MKNPGHNVTLYLICKFITKTVSCKQSVVAFMLHLHTKYHMTLRQLRSKTENSRLRYEHFFSAHTNNKKINKSLIFFNVIITKNGASVASI
jgi:hypothetical protein